MLNISKYLLLSFFFSSRRRHTRYWRDWSSDVCSSDLGERGGCRDGRRQNGRGQRRRGLGAGRGTRAGPGDAAGHRTGESRVGERVDFGGRRIIKKKKNTNKISSQDHNTRNKILQDHIN